MKRHPASQPCRFHPRALRTLTLCLVGGLTGALLSPNVRGELADRPDRTSTTNGTVRAVLSVGNTIYIGGSFDRVGPRTGPGVEVALDGSLNRGPQIAGAGPALFPGSGGNMSAVAADGSGGWYIGGLFAHVGHAPRTNLAHILANHRVDPNFKPLLDDAVYTMTVSGSTLYVAGNFTSVNGQSRHHIAALNVADGSLTAFDPNADNSVGALAVSNDGSTIYAGGYFSSIGGQPRSGLAALNAADGSATSFNPGVSGFVSALALSDSTLYVGGTFLEIGGKRRTAIAALSTVDGRVKAFNPSPTFLGCDACAGVNALAVSGSTIYAAGFFDTIGGQPRNKLAGLNAADGSATAFNPNPNNTVLALVVSGSTIYVAGAFSSTDGSPSIGGEARNFVASLNTDDGTVTSFDPNPNSLVRALAVTPSAVYLGGAFSGLGGVVRHNLAALRTADGHVTDFDPNVDGEVHALALSGSTVYLGGFFGLIGGQPRASIGAVNAIDGTLTDWNPGCDGDVTALAPSDGVIYAGGAFFNIGGQARLGIAALNLSDGNATSFNPSSNGFVSALVVSGPLLYAGGYFTVIGGQTRNKIAALNISDGTAAPFFDPDVTSLAFVSAIAVSDKTVYIGGSFSTIHGVPRQNIGAVNAGDGMPTSFDPEATEEIGGYPVGGYVFALAVSDSAVYAGGTFSMIGGQRRGLLAELDPVTGLATSFNPNGPPGFILEALTVGTDGTLYAGGLFNTFDLAYQQGFAAFSPRQLSLPNTLPAK